MAILKHQRNPWEPTWEMNWPETRLSLRLCIETPAWLPRFSFLPSSASPGPPVWGDHLLVVDSGPTALMAEVPLLLRVSLEFPIWKL